MSFALRSAVSDDLAPLAKFAVGCQADPQRHCAYLSEDEAALADDVLEVPDWWSSTLVALDDERNVIGWLLADTDPDSSRIWWWGPFVDDGDRAGQLVVAQALLSRGLRNHPDHDEHELAADSRSTLFAELAAQHGFARQEGSLALRLDDLAPWQDLSAHSVVQMPSPDVDLTDVIALHDQTFPGTHSSGDMLVRDIDAEHVVLASVDEGAVVGYVAVEVHNDGSLYIDYLGVEPAFRQRGLGRELVANALHWFASRCTHAHLTVREGNTGARALYASLGFTEARVLAPYRKGFTLD